MEALQNGVNTKNPSNMKHWPKRAPLGVVVNVAHGSSCESLKPKEATPEQKWKSESFENWESVETNAIAFVKKYGCVEFLKSYFDFTDWEIERAELYGIAGVMRIREGLEPNIISEERLARRRERGRLLREAERGK